MSGKRRRGRERERSKGEDHEASVTKVLFIG